MAIQLENLNDCLSICYLCQHDCNSQEENNIECMNEKCSAILHLECFKEYIVQYHNCGQCCAPYSDMVIRYAHINIQDNPDTDTLFSPTSNPCWRQFNSVAKLHKSGILFSELCTEIKSLESQKSLVGIEHTYGTPKVFLPSIGIITQVDSTKINVLSIVSKESSHGYSSCISSYSCVELDLEYNLYIIDSTDERNRMYSCFEKHHSN